jgi:glucose-1-phosphate adenylyltransferase
MFISCYDIYSMDYETMVTFHQDHHADLTLATIQVPIEEASRFGIVEVDESYRVVSFIEKPPRPASNLVNMGVYLFNTDLLDRALWEDHNDANSSHDFGKDILPHLIAGDKRVFAYPFSGYWVDVGAVSSYWQAHMDLLNPDPPLDLNNRSWIIHTRTEERPPARLLSGAKVEDSLVADGCVIEPGARVVRSVLSPGVHIRAGAQVMESILFTDVQVQAGARVQRAIVDKRVVIGEDARVGALNYPTRSNNSLPVIAMLGKNSVILPKMVIEPGASIGTDVIASDYPAETVRNGEFIQTRRMPYEI